MTNNQLTLSDFIVQKVIGEGSYGRAVLCKQISNDKFVVIKEISLKKLTEQEQRDAWKETKVLSLLHHPNIITYYGCFLQNNVLHIVMEYADNGDLSEEIRKSLNNNQHFDEDKILNWFVQICLALKHLHDRKILHRDLKNQNIFLLKDNTAKLGDFGIAKMLSSTSQMSNTAIGTPYYLSPEICQGKPYNMKSDIWSLGCILYELCTLHHPFDSNCLNGLIVKIQRAKPPPIPYYYSSSLRNLVDKLLQKVPAKRPSINQILELDFIRCRVPNFLSYAIERKEFCHTILHDFKPGESPEKAKVTPEDVENNNANLHFESKKDDSNSKGNRNRVNMRNRNGRQNAYRNIPRYSSNKNINADNRRKINKDEDKSPKLQKRVQSSPQISPIPTPMYQQQNIYSEEESAKSNENEQYFETDESYNEENTRDSNNYNDDDSYHSNQSYNYENKSNKNNQRKSVIRRRRNNDNQGNSPYIAPMRNLQAKKNAAVIADRAMVRELREKKAVEDRITQLKNEEKRREVQEKAKARELQRKEQMRRLKQEEKERQEKYKKLKPTFKIDRNVHYHNNTDSESNASISDIENDERRAERIKKRKEEEIRKENLKRNATAIAEKMKNNHIQSNSNYQENEIDQDINQNKKNEDNISSLREFLHQRRSEIRKNKQQEDVIMIGNMKYYVNNNNNNKIENSEKNEVNEKEILAKNSKKKIESEVYGLIFDNYKNNDNENDQNNNVSNSEEITKTEIENNIEYYSSDQLLTSDSNNNSTPQQNDSLLSNNSNENGQNRNELNAEEPSYLASSFESNNNEYKSNDASPTTTNVNNNSSPDNKDIIYASPISNSNGICINSPGNTNYGILNNNNNVKYSSPASTNSNINSISPNDNIIYARPGSSGKNSVKFLSPGSINSNGKNVSPNENIIYGSPTNSGNIRYASPNSINSNSSSFKYASTNNANNNNSGSFKYQSPNSINSNSGNIKYASQNSTNINNNGTNYVSPNSINNNSGNIKYVITNNNNNSTNYASPNSINNNSGNIKYVSPNNNNSNSIKYASPNSINSNSGNIKYASPNNTNNNSGNIRYVSPSSINSGSASPTNININYLSPTNINYVNPNNNSSSDNNVHYANPSNINYGSPISNTNNNNANPSMLSFNSFSPSSFKEKGESIGQIHTVNSDLQYDNRSPVESKSASSDYEYSPVHYYEKVRSANSSESSSSPLKSNDSEEMELKSAVNSPSQKIEGSEFGLNDKKDDDVGLKISSRQTTTVSGGLCVYSPMKALIENEKSNDAAQNVDDDKNNLVIDGSSAVNHKNTIIMQIDKLLNDSFSNSGNIDDEAEKSKKIQTLSPIRPEENKEEVEQNTEIRIPVQDQIGNNNNNEIVDPNPKKQFFSNNYNFTFKGNELRFDNIRSNDSLAYKIETVRKFIEDSLGIEKTIKAYRLAEENNFSNYKEVLTTPDQQSFYPLIMQLVSSEEILLAKWLK